MRDVTSEHKQELTYLAAYKYKKTESTAFVFLGLQGHIKDNTHKTN